MTVRRLYSLCFVNVICGISVSADAADNPNADSMASSLNGSTGLLRMATAELGERHALYVAAYGEYSRSTDLLVLGDLDNRTQGEVSGALTLNRNIEIFGAVVALANRDQESLPDGTEVTAEAFTGSLSVGTKLIKAIGRSLSAGGVVGIRVPSDWRSLPSATSVWLDLLCSLNLRALTTLPVRAHLSLGFYDDNSQKQYDFVGSPASERSVVMFGEGMGASRIRLSIGLDALLRDHPGRLKLHPFAEYHLEIITAYPDAGLLDQGPRNRDQQWLTVGTRLPVSSKVTLNGGIDLLLRPTGFPYGPPLPRYNIIVGASLPFQM